MHAMQPTYSPSSSRTLRVLMLEDRAIDAELIIDALRRAGYAPLWQRVETAAEFDRLVTPELDVILADYLLPQFDGLSALRRVQERKLDIPFILISGALGDERAVQCIKAGVTDYLLKDRLGRLGLAVANALEERRLRAEARRVEAQLFQAQKMESIGRLAGGIAHDFNNVLTVINGRTCLLLDDPSLPGETRDALNEIFTAGERAASLTRQLLLFSRKRSIQKALVDLNDIVQDVAQMLGRLIGENIALKLELASDLPTIEADSSMMEQILMNLAVNARDAMPDSGELTISTCLRTLAAGDIRHQPDASPGTYVCLRVTDTGTGIAPDIMPRIFEPFFTTKGVGNGTGLGLATTFGIVKQHQGWRDVASEVGVGTTFSIFLPIAVAQPYVPAIRNDPPAWPTGGRDTILLVEDEQCVREFAVAVLQPLGYRVLQARSGEDALEVWKWHGNRISLLLTDMVMPGDLSGLQLAQQLQAQKPSLRVVYTSGYTEEKTQVVFGFGDATRFIHKPYHPRALAQIVRETLDSSDASLLRPAAS